MKRLITLDIAPATETHCGPVYGGGGCPEQRHGGCGLFGGLRRDTEADLLGAFIRHPKCIAAEVKQ